MWSIISDANEDSLFILVKSNTTGIRVCRKSPPAESLDYIVNTGIYRWYFAGSSSTIYVQSWISGYEIYTIIQDSTTNSDRK